MFVQYFSRCLVAILCVVWACRTQAAGSGNAVKPEAHQALAVQANAPGHEVVVETVYDAGLQSKWQDFGWAPRDTEVGKPARLNFARYAGWILNNKSGLSGHFSRLTMRLRAPAKFKDFLEVRLAAEADDSFPRIVVGPTHRHTPDPTGWVDVQISMLELNPSNLPFNKVILRAKQSVDTDWVEIDKLALWANSDGSSVNAAVQNYPKHRSSLQINCTQPTKQISPLIYGIAYNPRRHASDNYMWQLGATARRWGGNPASRFNWQIGHAWNTANDWFYTNVNYAENNFSWKDYLEEDRQHGVKTALTLPMLGWVAKDTTSYAYPVSVYGPQKRHTGPGGDIGNGVLPSGAKIENADANRTSVPAPPEFVKQWVQAINAIDASSANRSVDMYILDNEPALWNSTHRDVHPEPLSYDELLKRTIDYGTVVRQADKQAVIAGPAEWGWPAYFFSALDAAAGFTKKPDRRAHGDVPLLAWYLQQLRSHELRTGVRVLNVLDVHYYPQTSGVYGQGERNDADAAETRIRSTRSLWDPTYKDESWIADRIRLLPRLRALIEENYPGLGISIGEYNFGGEKYMSGALALAEVLGRFGQEGVYSAFYWTYPAENSCAYHAFRAYRNYDGQGAHFLNRSMPVTGDRSTSLFASQDDTGKQVVAVLLNLDAHEGADATIDLVGCGDVKVNRTFQYTGSADGMRLLGNQAQSDKKSAVQQSLPPYSITVLEMNVDRTRHLP